MSAFQDAREIPEATRIEADLCIIGAGAAGITLARSFIGRNVKVCLLESGGLDFDPDVQALYEGQLLGHDDHPLDVSRLRFFGGSTNHWNGHLRRLGRDDFERRDWIPYSGWPISWHDVDRYLRAAAEVVQIMGAYHWQPDGLEDHLQTYFFDPEVRENDRLEPSVFHHSPPTRFGEVYRDELRTAANVDVYLYANTVDFNASENSQHVVGVQVKTLGGRTFTVEARQFVLATGGIENARLLLAGARTKPGFGTGNDLVGRFFLDHPIAEVGRLHLVGASSLFSVPYSPPGIGALVSLSEPTRRQERLSRMVCRMRPVYPPQILIDRRTYQAWWRLRGALSAFFSTGETPDHASRDLMAVLSDLDGFWRYRQHFHDQEPTDTVMVEATIEQLPNPESRLRLIDEVDALGMPRVALDWRFTTEDMSAWRRSVELLGQELGALGIGRLQADAGLLEADPGWFGGAGSYHHSGTTRMSDHPRQGVVDGNGRVHGVDNLFVVGSSIFPTIGDANPTLTIVALVLRLADHLNAAFQAA